MKKYEHLELIVDYLNSEFYYSVVDNGVYSVSNENQKVGYQQLEDIIKKMFAINEDMAHLILFNWLLTNDAHSIKENWYKRYIIHNSNTSITEDINLAIKYNLVNV